MKKINTLFIAVCVLFASVPILTAQFRDIDAEMATQFYRALDRDRARADAQDAPNRRARFANIKAGAQENCTAILECIIDYQEVKKNGTEKFYPSKGEGLKLLKLNAENPIGAESVTFDFLRPFDISGNRIYPVLLSNIEFVDNYAEVQVIDKKKKDFFGKPQWHSQRIKIGEMFSEKSIFFICYENNGTIHRLMIDEGNHVHYAIDGEFEVALELIKKDIRKQEEARKQETKKIISEVREWTFVPVNGKEQKFNGTLIEFRDNYAVFTDKDGKKITRLAKQFSESDIKLMKEFVKYFPEKNNQSKKAK